MFLIFSILILILFSFTNQFAYICPTKEQSLPQSFTPSSTYKLSTFTYNSNTYTQLEIGKTIWLSYSTRISSYSTDKQTNVCPPNYRIPVLSDFENLLANLTSNSSINVYNYITDVDKFNLPSGSYAVSNTKADNDSLSYYFYTLYVNETAGTVSIKNVSLATITQPVYAKCIIESLTPDIEITPQSNYNYVGDSKNFAVDNTNLIGNLWRINKDNDNVIINNFNISYSFVNNGLNMIESWYYDILGYLHYKCKNIFIDKNVSYTFNSFNFNNDYKKLNTSETVNYNNKIHFTYSNAPVAPRFHGGYYIAFKSKSDNYIHILSYDKNDSLVKNFNTNINGNVLDITATSTGFAIYISSIDGTLSRSYINIYNINFTLLYTANIMNNNYSNKNNNGENIKQYITNDNNKIVPGTEFMYNPLSGKLLYSNGRIFLIFSYNNYNSSDSNLNGDTIISFNETGSDLDFSAIWGTSQSFIQSVTEEKDWVWTASLSDKLGLNVFHTSKINFTNSSTSTNTYYYRERYHYSVNNLFGTITYSQNNFSYAKLGGLVYFPSYEILAMVFSQTKDSSQGKDGIYLALFSYASLNYDAHLFPLKEFDSSEVGVDIFNIRAGKLDNSLIILYALSTSSENVDKNTGNLPKGKNTMMMVVKIKGKDSYSIVSNSILVGTDAIGTNEEMKNFKDGRLIWTSVDANGYILVHRLGTLSDYNDEENDDNDVITTIDNNDENKSSETNKDNSENKENSGNNSKNNSDNNKSSSGSNKNNSNSKSNGNNSTDKNKSMSSSTNEDDSSTSSSDDDKKNNLLIFILIGIILLLLILLIIVCACCCKKKSDESSEENNKESNKKKEKNNDDKENNNNTHVSQAASNVNLNSNLGTNTISVYKDMNKN